MINHIQTGQTPCPARTLRNKCRNGGFGRDQEFIGPRHILWATIRKMHGSSIFRLARYINIRPRDHHGDRLCILVSFQQKRQNFRLQLLILINFTAEG